MVVGYLARKLLVAGKAQEALVDRFDIRLARDVGEQIVLKDILAVGAKYRQKKQ